MKFGEYIRTIRMEKKISLRNLASRVGISPPYLSDIEKGNRYPPTKLLSRLSDTLRLTNEERQMMYDLAGEARNEIPEDIAIYLRQNESARKAVRYAKENSIQDEAWRDVITYFKFQAEKNRT